MATTQEQEALERLIQVEKTAAWLKERVWDGVGNLHDRVHVLEDKNGDRVHEISILQAEYAKVERVLGLNGYGDKNVLNDLRDALDTIEKIKDGIITRKDFQSFTDKLNVIDEWVNDQKREKKEGWSDTKKFILGALAFILNTLLSIAIVKLLG
jgi:hypothetical protein